METSRWPMSVWDTTYQRNHNKTRQHSSKKGDNNWYKPWDLFTAVKIYYWRFLLCSESKFTQVSVSINRAKLRPVHTEITTEIFRTSIGSRVESKFLLMSHTRKNVNMNFDLCLQKSNLFIIVQVNVCAKFHAIPWRCSCLPKAKEKKCFMRSLWPWPLSEILHSQQKGQMNNQKRKLPTSPAHHMHKGL